MCLRVDTCKRKWARFLVCVRVCVSTKPECIRCAELPSRRHKGVSRRNSREQNIKLYNNEYVSNAFCCCCFRFFSSKFLCGIPSFLVQRMQWPCIELDTRAAIQQTEQHTNKLRGSRSLNSSALMK